MAEIVLTMRDLVESQEGIQDLESRELEHKTGYRLAKITRKVVAELRAFNAAGNAVREKYRRRNEDDTDWVYDQAAIAKAVDELLDEEVKLDIPLIPFELLPARLKGRTYRVLWFVFVDEPREEEIA